MPHADAALFPSEATKDEAYELAYQQLQGLFEDQRIWICNLANAASLLWALFHSRPEPLSRVNWAGFYVRSDLFPGQDPQDKAKDGKIKQQLLLAPFAGLPACQSIPLPGKDSGRQPGVCAAAFLTGETQLVPDVERRPGHIACDANTRSEIVVPLKAKDGTKVGVLDIDCELEGGIDAADQKALERIAALIGMSCDWS